MNSTATGQVWKTTDYRWSSNDGTLQVEDPNNRNINILLPVADDEFIDYHTAEKFTFNRTDDGAVAGFLFDGYFPFKKVEK